MLRGERVGEGLVHLDVAPPGPLGLPVEARRVGQVEQGVMDEPQHAVRDHVVEAGEGGGLNRDVPNVVLRILRQDLDAALWRPLGYQAVALSHGGGDPQAPGGLQGAGQPGDQPAQPPALDHLAVRVEVVRDGSAVGGDDHRAPWESFGGRVGIASRFRPVVGQRVTGRHCSSLPIAPNSTARVPEGAGGGWLLGLPARGGVAGRVYTNPRGTAGRRPARGWEPSLGRRGRAV